MKTTFFAAFAAMFAVIGLDAQMVKVTMVPRLTGIATCINMVDPLARRVSNRVYELGSRQITVGAGACRGMTQGLGFFFLPAKKLDRIQRSNQGGHYNGYPWAIDAVIIIIKDGIQGAEVARATGSGFSGNVSSGGIYEQPSDGEAVAHAERQAVDRLFEAKYWHIGAHEAMARAFSPAPTATPTGEQRAQAELEALRQHVADLQARAAQATANTAEKKQLEAELKKAQAELKRAQRPTKKK